MDTIILLIVVAKIIQWLVNRDKKGQTAKQAHEQRQPVQPPQPVQAPAKPAQPVTKPAAPAMPASIPARKQPAAPAARPVPAEGRRPLESVMQPRVHTHLAPDCEVHDGPGSLGVTSREGKDDCHADQLAPAKEPRPAYAAAEAPGSLQLDWSGENMVKAFIMQEVLTRPSQRMSRK